jgi:hypothetical protein
MKHKPKKPSTRDTRSPGARNLFLTKLLEIIGVGAARYLLEKLFDWLN